MKSEKAPLWRRAAALTKVLWLREVHDMVQGDRMILQVRMVCKVEVDTIKSVMVLLKDTRRVKTGRGEVKSPAWHLDRVGHRTQFSRGRYRKIARLMRSSQM